MRQICGALLMLFLALAGCGTMRPAILNRAFSDDLEEARKLIRTGHLKQAVDELTQLIDMDPKNREARFLRGAAYQNLEEFDLAVADFEGVLNADPRHAKASYNLGMIFAYKLRDPPRALATFDRFLSAAPDQDRAFAVAKIMCSLDASHDPPPGDRWLPDLLQKAEESKDPEEKRKRLLEAANLNPRSPVPRYLIGKSYEEEGKTDEAIRAYREALETRPTCAPCHQSLGRLLIVKKRGEEGRGHLAKAELFDPNHSQSDLKSAKGDQD